MELFFSHSSKSNRKSYGRDLGVPEILSGQVPVPPAAWPVIKILQVVAQSQPPIPPPMPQPMPQQPMPQQPMPSYPAAYAQYPTQYTTQYPTQYTAPYTTPYPTQYREGELYPPGRYDSRRSGFSYVDTAPGYSNPRVSEYDTFRNNPSGYEVRGTNEISERSSFRRKEYPYRLSSRMSYEAPIQREYYVYPQPIGQQYVRENVVIVDEEPNPILI